MKKTILLPMIVGALVFTVEPARADSPTVENALQTRPDLSEFYHALRATGVANELRPDVTYTVFAPTNAAWEQMMRFAPSCYSREECRAMDAHIVRNHIVPEKVYVRDAAEQHGGLFSIGHRFINIGSPTRNTYAVDGNTIVDTRPLGNGMLYKINGVIAKPRDYAMVDETIYVAPEQETVTTSQNTIADPACGPAGCPDRYSESRTVTRSVVTEGPYASFAR